MSGDAIAHCVASLVARTTAPATEVRLESGTSPAASRSLSSAPCAGERPNDAIGCATRTSQSARSERSETGRAGGGPVWPSWTQSCRGATPSARSTTLNVGSTAGAVSRSPFATHSGRSMMLLRGRAASVLTQLEPDHRRRIGSRITGHGQHLGPQTRVHDQASVPSHLVRG